MRVIFAIIVSFFFIKSNAQGDFMDAHNIPSTKDLQFYEEDGLMGIKKNSRKLITPAIYDTLYQVTESKYVGKRFSTNKQQSLWGLLDNSGEVIIPFNYFTCEVLNQSLILGSAEANRVKLGLYDLNGNNIIFPRYDEIFISSGHIVGRSGKSNTIFTIAGEKLKEYLADSLRFLDSDHVKLFHDGKAGLDALDNSISLAAEFEDIKIETNSVYVKRFPKWLLIQGYDTISFNRSSVEAWGKHYIATVGQKSQVVNNNKINISSTYDEIVIISNQLAKVRTGMKWGVIDATGKNIISVSYAEILADKEFLGAKIMSNKPKWTVFDLYGFPKTKLTYDSVKLMSNGRIPVKRNDRWGYLDRYGVEIIAPIFEEAHSFKDELAHVRFFGQSGLIDREGKWVIPPINQRILDYNTKVILSKFGDQYQVHNYMEELIYFTNNSLELIASGINETDSLDQFIRKISWEGTILSDIYAGESVRTGGSGLTIFKDKGRFGFKDHQGRIIIANRYEEVKPFHQRMAAIKIRNKWGFIDIDEILRVQPRFDSVGNYVDGSCIVAKNGQLGVVDMKGTELIEPKYEKITRLSNNRYRVQQNGKWGFIGESGEIIIHPKYTVLKATNQGYFIVKRDGRYGTISEDGVNKIPLIYDFIDFDLTTKTLIIREAYKQEWAFAMKTHPVN